MSPWVCFGTHEAQVLFASENGSTAVPERSPATHHLKPLWRCPCRCGEDGLAFSWIPCAVWSMTCRACFHHLAGCPSQKRAPNYTPFFSFCPGRVGQGACHLLPSPAKLRRALLCAWSWFDTRCSSDECLPLELWLCLSGMMQPHKNVKHLS